MPSSRAVQTLLLLPDPRETPLGEVSGAGLGRGVHTPYGHAEPSLVARTGFNGQPREACGWYQLGNGHRVYNPALMRFHSPDRLSPFGEGGLNAYAYCLGDPVNFTDPSGRFALDIPGFVMDHLFDQPIAQIVHNSALLVGALMLNMVAPPAGAAVAASLATIVGSGVGIAGNIMQFAGQKEIGGQLATLGTTISSIASTIRVQLAAEKLKDMNAMSFKNFWKGNKQAFFGGGKKSPAKNVIKQDEVVEGMNQVRTSSQPVLAGTQVRASGQRLSDVRELPEVVPMARQRKMTQHLVEIGHIGPYIKKQGRKLSVHRDMWA